MLQDSRTRLERTIRKLLARATLLDGILIGVGLVVWSIWRTPLVDAFYEGRLPVLGEWGGGVRPRSVEYYAERADYWLAWSALSSLLLLGAAWMALAPFPTAVCFGVAGVAAAVTIAWHPLVETLVVGESRSVVDTLSAPLFLCASLMLLVAARARPHGRVLLIVLAGFFFVVAGEEASWLQHAIEYETPRVVRRYNEQREFNLHNMSTKPVDALFQMGMAFLFIALPAMCFRPASAGRPLRTWLVAFAILFTTRVCLARSNDTQLVTWFFRGMAASTVLLAILAPRMTLRPRVDSALTWIRTALEPRQELVASGAILFATWIAYGVRFRCLGDLEWGPSSWPANIDGELFELYSALLAIALAGGALRAPRVATSATSWHLEEKAA